MDNAGRNTAFVAWIEYVRLGTNPFLYPLALIIVVSFKTNGSLYTGAFSSGSVSYTHLTLPTKRIV